MSRLSISQLLNAAGSGDQSAATALFERCFDRLCRVVRGRLVRQLQQRIDPEDIVLSAYRSFFVGLEKNRFHVEDSSDLWALLVTITFRKLARSQERHFAAKRDLRCTINQTDGFESNQFADQPAVEFTHLLREELSELLKTLSDRDRMIAQLRLSGDSIAEIAETTGCSDKTVQRVLKEIRAPALIDGDLHSVDWETIVGRIFGRSLSTSSPKLPTRFEMFLPGRMQLQKMIGFGGTSKVYRAIDRHNKQPVAVKFLRQPLQHDSFAVSRFLKELELTADLQHPGVLKIRGIGKTKAGDVFLVTDLCQSDLSRLPAPIPWKHVFIIVLKQLKLFKPVMILGSCTAISSLPICCCPMIIEPLSATLAMQSK